MDQNNKKINDDFDMKDVSNDKNINYVNGKNATTNSNNEFVIKDLSFEDFKFDAKLEGGNTTMKSDDSSSEKSSSDNNTSSGTSSDSNDTSASDNKNDSNSNTSNDNDMKDVSDDNSENSSSQSNSSESPSPDDSDLKDKNDKDKKDDSDSKDKDDKDKKDDSDSKDKKDSDDKDKDKEKDKKDESNDRDKEKKRDGLDDKDKKNTNKNKEDSNNKNNKENNGDNKNNNKKDKENKTPNETPKKNDSNKKNNSDRKPNPYQRKKDELKNKWNNRPRTPKDFAKRAGNGLKNKAKDAVNNSAPGRAVNKAKETVQKTKETIEKTKKIVKHLIKYWKVYAIGIGVGLVVFAVIIFCSLTATGINGDVNNEGAEEKYSEKDQETLKELKDIFESHPGVDGTVAMATVALPYYEVMINGNVKGYLNAPTPSDKDEDTEDSDSTETTTDSGKNDIEETDIVGDDTYLAVFRKKKVRKRLNKLLEEFGKGEDSYKSYLKDSYFKSDGGYSYLISRPSFITGYNGYKKMFADIKEEYKDKQEALKDAIIENIYEISSLFAPYVYENSECVANLIDAGSISTTELLKANVLVDLMKPGCSSIDSCTESYYDHYLTLEEYIKGVVYEEMGRSTDVDVLAAQMVAAKTYTLSRHSPKKDPTSGAYVMTMLWSTADQDFCHTEKGCDSSDIKPYYGYNTGGDDRLMHGNNHGPLSDNQKKLYDSAWNKSKDTYILDKNGNPAKVSYWEGGGCNPGNCMEQSALEAMTNTGDYNIILSKFYTNFSLATVKGDSTNIQQVGAPVCTGNTQNLAAKRNKVVSFANKYVKKIPYDKDKLAKVSGFEGNNFGIETREVAGTPAEFKTGLGVVGFVNWVYWSTINENFGNTNDIQKIISSSFEITKDKLLLGDIGYSADKSLVAIYAGDEKWIYEDSISNNVIIQPSDKFTKFIRLNSFKDEIYDYPIRTKRPTPTEWNMNDTSKWAYYANEFIGECPWFARNRAAEIINGLYDSGSLTKAKYKTLISRVVCCYGDGGQFFPGGAADGGCGTKKFKGSTNIKDIKTGSFLSKSSGSQWGHVMVVEYANPQEDKIILSDGYNKSGMDDMCTKTNFNCGVMNFNTQYTYQQFYNEFSSTFKGYLYFLEE